MKFRYFTDPEHQRAFFEFEGFRQEIIKRLSKLYQVRDGVVLDFLSGHGLLSAEFATRFPKSRVIGIGLANDVQSWKQILESNRYPKNVWKRFHYIHCDATSIPIRQSTCDLIINFLGLENLHMTRGRQSLIDATSEVARISKPSALIRISLVEYGESPEEQ